MYVLIIKISSPATNNKNLKKVEDYGFSDLLNSTYFCKSGLSLIVDAAHLSDVLVAADSCTVLKLLLKA
jgi:hypothetical protein